MITGNPTEDLSNFSLTANVDDLIDFRNDVLNNSNLTEELRRRLLNLENILERTPDDFYIIGKSKDLQKALETIHEYFPRAIAHVNSTDVEYINRVGYNV
jgi:hypothetical protein